MVQRGKQRPRTIEQSSERSNGVVFLVGRTSKPPCPCCRCLRELSGDGLMSRVSSVRTRAQRFHGLTTATVVSALSRPKHTLTGPESSGPKFCGPMSRLTCCGSTARGGCGGLIMRSMRRGVPRPPSSMMSRLWCGGVLRHMGWAVSTLWRVICSRRNIYLSLKTTCTLR